MRKKTVRAAPIKVYGIQAAAKAIYERHFDLPWRDAGSSEWAYWREVARVSIVAYRRAIKRKGKR